MNFIQLENFFQSGFIDIYYSIGKSSSNASSTGMKFYIIALSLYNWKKILQLRIFNYQKTVIKYVYFWFIECVCALATFYVPQFDCFVI